MKRASAALVARALGCAAVAALLLMGCDRIEALWHGDRCMLSGRTVHPEMAVDVLVGGKRQGRACCLSCALTYAQQTGKKVRILWVTDFETGKSLRPRDAIYVVGSNVEMCAGPPLEASAGRHECFMRAWDRCAPSMVAFKSADKAEDFRKEHGGKIERFEDFARSEKNIEAPAG